MRKFAALVLMLLIGVSPLIAQDTDFRSTSWGMTKSEVKSAEDNQLLQEKANVLYYSDDLAGEQVYVVYQFEGQNNTLNQGQYILNAGFESGSQFVEYFESLESTMREDYGSPEVDTTLVQAEQYQDKPAEGLENGEVQLQTSWQTEETEIVIQLWNGDRGIQLAVQYIGKTA
ncbi:MAG: hypothetical protein K9N46_01750 [Candidatus Marinimicrobia bacterium]|nr:hypothetical protein [Candidatus Neomarinimicrobiota bacterium]MCF7827799.1 hypothetical protein [Candidatus Neomarinimicrobiota bacterium]MCF7879446.1 hypothetical protein [Candidatus Neomarinimicrobiota bacterium]